MKRRTFIQAVAATLFAPTALLQAKADSPLDPESILKQFVDDYSARWDIAEPFPIGSLVYATDARVAIRCELSTIKHDGEDKRRPPVESVWQNLWKPARWEPLNLPSPERLTHYMKDGPCPYCDDRRISHGSVYPRDTDSLLDYDPDGNTSRDPSCPACRGRMFKGPNVMLVCGKPFYYSMLKKIALVPDVMVCHSQSEVPLKHDDAPMLFRGGPFEGVAMGIRPEGLKRI